MKRIDVQINDVYTVQTLVSEIKTTFAPSEYVVVFYDENSKRVLVRSLTSEEKERHDATREDDYPEEVEGVKFFESGPCDSYLFLSLLDSDSGLFKGMTDTEEELNYKNRRTDESAKLRQKIEAGTATPAEQLLWRVYQTNLTKE